jgi:hypothetical protein
MNDIHNLSRAASEMRNYIHIFHNDSTFSRNHANGFLVTYIKGLIKGYSDLALKLNNEGNLSDSFLVVDLIFNQLQIGYFSNAKVVFQLSRPIQIRVGLRNCCQCYFFVKTSCY